MHLKKINFIITLFVIMFFVSCDKKQFFSEYKELDGTWKKADTLRFTFDQNDTVNPYHLFLNVRNNNDYPFSNMYLIVTMKEPGKNPTIKVDTLEYLMANPDGTLLGEGFSDIKESKLWYLENFKFKKAGKYNVEVVQAVRELGKVEGVAELKGITELGLRIEKIN
ncbi:gliding motility lipoprotein GldH [Flavobacterium cyclinae]|uniref:gliding motility lipoprotein GldH n=1 Tax=Flavobacterium cyclinae TaxID=2895947 RepID=UPI001E60A13E|nr:gliding motility lipoprotein GldH [Flavobacterium cyclinae]UGS21157.1 gliding motility lipoprotein GldH [Flavobacterium cyclinae]